MTTNDFPQSTSTPINPLFDAAGLMTCLDSLQTNVFVADTDLNLVYANKKALATVRTFESEIFAAFGVRVDELVGASIHRFHRDPARVEQVLRTPAALPHSAEFMFGDITLRTEIGGLQDEDGNIIGYIVNWEDISEERRRRVEMGRTTSMMENSPTNVIYADRDLVVRYLNPASMATLKQLEHLLPCKADEIVGQSIDIFHKSPEHQRKLLADPNRLPVRTNIQLGPETLDLLVSAIYDHEGEHIGAMATWEVITEKPRDRSARIKRSPASASAPRPRSCATKVDSHAAKWSTPPPPGT